ncbi:MAG: PAC2 family protein [Armatimonadota bacterium]
MQDLEITRRPDLDSPILLVGFTGWMDGGNVSTGTVSYIRDQLGATECAEINPLDFYVHHFPISTLPISISTEAQQSVFASISPMEFAAVFRPHVDIEDGVIKEIVYEENTFWASKEHDILLFSGEEPHVRWGSYMDCIFEIAQQFNVSGIYFIGSVAGAIPHTREPRVRATVATEALKKDLQGVANVEFGDYAGPSGLVTSLADEAAQRGVNMWSLVVEIPHYPFLEMPTYPKSMLNICLALNALLDIEISLETLYDASAQVEQQLNETMQENEDFEQLVRKLEQAYDRERSQSDEDLLKRLIDDIDLEQDEGGH